jgi:uncharacterized protein
MATPPGISMEPPRSWTRDDVAAAVSAWVAGPHYPCLGARSVFRRGLAEVGLFDELGSAKSGGALVEELVTYADQVDLTEGLTSYVAAFRGPVIRDEEHFERLLWQQLQSVHDHDAEPWDASVSSNPDSSHFGFSVGGRAYFVIGMHPQASRMARRTPFPVLVFNLHEQFDRMRGTPRFDGLRDAVRRRDEQLQGSRNPMVQDYGRSSEARQYSGRQVDETWSPTFSPRPSRSASPAEEDSE